MTAMPNRAVTVIAFLTRRVPNHSELGGSHVRPIPYDQTAQTLWLNYFLSGPDRLCQLEFGYANLSARQALLLCLTSLPRAA